MYKFLVISNIIYRLNESTGATWYLTNGAWNKIKENK